MPGIMRYSPFRHVSSIFRKRRPIQLTFFLTRRCNARCPFCFYLSRTNSGEPELTLDEIERASASLGSLLWLAFSGGEPFLREDIVEIAQAFYRNNRPSILLLPTNGLLPGRVREQTEAILKQCPKSTVVVKVSLDGPAEVHDLLRRVPGAFQKALETVDSLRPLLTHYPNFELGINTVFCSANQGYVDGLIDFAQGLEGVSTHTVSLVRGEVAEEGLKEVDLKAYGQVIKKLEADLKRSPGSGYRFRGSRLKTAQDILQRRMIYDTAEKNKRLIPCYAGRLTLVLTETGELYPCESFASRMGNVREWGYDVKKLMAGMGAQAALRAVQESGCHCTHECYMMMNILFNPALYPSLAKEYLSL